MKEDHSLHIKIKNNYYAPPWAYVRPFQPFNRTNTVDVALRKTFTLSGQGGTRFYEAERASGCVVLIAGLPPGCLVRLTGNPFRSRKPPQCPLSA